LIDLFLNVHLRNIVTLFLISFSDAEFVFESRQLAELMQLAYSSHLRQEVVFHVEKTGGKFFFRRLHGDRVAPKYSKFESVRTIQGKMIKFYLISSEIIAS